VKVYYVPPGISSPEDVKELHPGFDAGTDFFYNNYTVRYSRCCHLNLLICFNCATPAVLQLLQVLVPAAWHAGLPCCGILMQAQGT
jgi:hypothetical protein